MDTAIGMRLRTATELGQPRRLVLNIGCWGVADVREVAVDGVWYQVDPPRQEQGYYAVTFDVEDRVIRLRPTNPRDGDRFVRAWKTDPEFGDVD